MDSILGLPRWRTCHYPRPEEAQGGEDPQSAESSYMERVTLNRGKQLTCSDPAGKEPTE